MQYTEEQLRNFRIEFGRRRARQLALAAVLIGFVVAFQIPRIGGPEILPLPPQALATSVVVFLVGALVVSFRNWRCPACNAYLGKASNPRFCSECGVPLRERGAV